MPLIFDSFRIFFMFLFLKFTFFSRWNVIYHLFWFQLKEDLAFLTEDSVPPKKPKLESGIDSKLNTLAKERDRTRDASQDFSHRDRRESEEREVHKPTLKEDPSWLDIGLDVKTKKASESTEKRFILGENSFHLIVDYTNVVIIAVGVWYCVRVDCVTQYLWPQQSK